MQTSVFLDIVGEGELRENVEALIQKYKLQNVHLHGQKTGRELLEFYQSADIFVLPSLKEGFSNSMLEALAAGLPVECPICLRYGKSLANVGCSFKIQCYKLCKSIRCTFIK